MTDTAKDEYDWEHEHMTALRNAIAATDETLISDAQLLAQPGKLKLALAQAQAEVLALKSTINDIREPPIVMTMATTELREERDALKLKLATADALLKQALPYLRGGQIVESIIYEIDAHLNP